MPKAAIQSVMDAFQKANSGLTVKINTVDHNTFQENINNYLQGSPDEGVHVVRRLPDAVLRRPEPRRGHLRRLDRVQGLNDALKKSSTGDDGKQYFMPSTYYPWALFYRKSLWQEKGYEVPTTLDELKTLMPR